jgi:hypothetical protein
VVVGLRQPVQETVEGSELGVAEQWARGEGEQVGELRSEDSREESVVDGCEVDALEV